MEFPRRSKWLAGNAAIFLVSGAAAFLASSPGMPRPELLRSSAQKDRTGGDSLRQQAVFLQFEQVQQTVIQSEEETEKRLTLLQSAAARLSPEEYPAAVRAALNWPAREREAFLSAIARRWAAADAPGACTFFAALGDPDLRITVTGAALETWAGTAARDALNWLQTQPESTLRTELLDRLIKLTQEHDPALALAAFNLLPEKQRNPDRRRRLALQLADTDARAAVIEMSKTDLFKQSDHEALLKIAERCIQTDLSGTLAWLKTLDGRESGFFGQDLRQAWGRVDPHVALEWARQSGAADSWTWPSNATDVIYGWAEKDPLAARAYVESLPPGKERKEFLGPLIRQLGIERKDIRTLIALCRERDITGDDDLLRRLRGLIRDGVCDHDKVVTALRALPHDERNQELLDSFLVSWSKKNPVEAAEYMGAKGLAAKNPLAAATVAKDLAGLDPERATNWAMQLPAGEARESAISAALQELAATDAARAWVLCEANLPQARQGEVAPSVAGVWADRDPASAAAWAGRLPDETARARAFGAIAKAWAQSNLQDCMTWLQALDAGPVRDHAIQGYVSQALYQDPQSALTVAASIGDTGQRLKQLTDITNIWDAQNHREVARWISTTDCLSPSIKQWLLSK